MSIFDFEDYKKFVEFRLEQAPKKGHGQFRKIAEHLDIQTSMVSQIFRGDKDLSLEQAAGLCTFLGLNELETDYFLLLVQVARSGTSPLRKILDRHIEKIRSQGMEIKSRIPTESKLDDIAKSVFYSQWYYSAARLLTSINDFDSAESIGEHLHLPSPLIHQVIQFLLAHGLCVKTKGKIKLGPKRTHLEADSPLVGRHHMNWRIKAFEKMSNVSQSELFFTSPMTISQNDAIKFRQLLVNFIEEFMKRVADSPAEKLSCLNVDWFHFV